MNVYAPVRVTPLEAAKVQLDTAIALFFLNAHPAPIHSLLGAAQELLKGLTKAQARTAGVPCPETHLDSEEMALRVMNTARLNDIRNFLKHYVGKPEVVLNANKNINWMLDCIQSLAALNEPSSALVDLHIEWVLTVYTKHVTFPPDTTQEAILERVRDERGYPYATADETIAWLRQRLTSINQASLPGWFRQAVDGWETAQDRAWRQAGSMLILQREAPAGTVSGES